MKLIIMTKSSFFVEEDKIISTLFEEGLDNLHLSKLGAEPVYSERLLTLLPEDCYGKITVHDHFYLKEEYGLKGIHIDDTRTEAPAKYKGYLSRTCQTVEELKGAKKESDYVFLANTFPSPGKPGTRFSREQLEAASRGGLIDKRVYALGGVSLDNISLAKDLGFGGVVVCSDLWSRFDIHQQLDYKELIEHFCKLQKATN